MTPALHGLARRTKQSTSRSEPDPGMSGITCALGLLHHPAGRYSLLEIDGVIVLDPRLLEASAFVERKRVPVLGFDVDGNLRPILSKQQIGDVS